MADLYQGLAALPCRHLLAILDCCFAGTFRWSATRHMYALPEVIHQERYVRFIRDPAWQAITSAAYDQKALDVLSGGVLGNRGESKQHSPFALALFEALSGKGDVVPAGGDGVITATELYLYLRDWVEVKTEEIAGRYQTPELWPLPRHNKGEYIFLVPGQEPDLPPAPQLSFKNNPYRGLQAYDEAHSQLFFGRSELVQQLVEVMAKQPLTTIVGASGSGKSSLVKAGLISRLGGSRQAGDSPQLHKDKSWFILPPMRPGAAPLAALSNLLTTFLLQPTDLSDRDLLKTSPDSLAQIISDWARKNRSCALLLVVDQLEELITQCWDSEERQQFLTLLARAIETQSEHFHLVLTVRSDFEPQFVDGPMARFWKTSRFIVPPMNQDELRKVIEGPASVRVLYFDPDELVDDLINEVIQTPGALPLLSFTLSELYVKYLQSGRNNRTLTQADYNALGGVIGALRTRAGEEYDNLSPVNQDTMRRIMLRMVSTEGGELARRRVPREELVYPDEAENERVELIIRQLVAARLMVEGSDASGKAYVEPAHDALIRAWDRLLDWKKAADAYLPLQRRVSHAAQEWQRMPEAGKKEGLLWTNNPQLPQLEEMLWPETSAGSGLRKPWRNTLHRVRPPGKPEQQNTWLNQLETRFIQASVARRARNMKRIAGITLLVILSLAALTVFALVQRNEAIDQSKQAAAEVVIRTTAEAGETEARILAEEGQAKAEEQTALARSRELAALVPIDIQNGDLVQAHQRAANAHLIAQTSESRQALQLVLAQPWPGTIFNKHEFSVRIASFSPDGTLAMTAAERDEEATIWDTHTGEVLIKLIGHSEPLTSAAFDPTGSRIVTTSTDGTARLWDLEGKELVSFQNHSGPVSQASFSPDGSLILSTGVDGTSRLWDQSGQERALFQIHDGNLKGAHFSPDGDRILTAGDDGTARLWDLTGSEIGAYSAGPSTNNKAIFSPNGEQILTLNDYGKGQIWETSTSEQLAAIEGHEQPINSAEFSPDGKRIVTASHDKSARVWDAENGQELLRLVHTDRVSAAGFSPDGEQIVTASWDNRARIWDSTDGQELSVLGGHQERFVHWAGFSPDGNQIMSAAYGEVRIWELQKGGESHSLEHDAQIEQADFSTDGKLIVTASWDGTARIWDVGKGNELVVLNGADGAVTSAHFSPDGKLVVTAYGNGAVKVWDVLSGDQLAIVRSHTDPINWVDFSPDQRVIVTAGSDGAVRVWAWQSELEPTILQGHDDEVTSLDFSPDGKQIVTASNDHSARIWDIDSGSELVQLTGHTDWLTSASFDSTGSKVVTSSYDGTARLWDVEQGQEILTLLPQSTEILSASFSPGGEKIVTAGADPNLAQVWLAESGQELARFDGHTDAILHAAFSPDGLQVITASRDHTSRLWDVETGTEVARFAGHGDDVNWAEFSPDGKWIVTTSQDNSAKVWPSEAMSVVQQRLAELGITVGPAEAQTLAFVSYRGGNADIYTMDIDGSNLDQITNDAAADVDPAWSPDGTHIAFCSDRDGNNNIYLVKSNGSDLLQLTDDPGDDCDPTWSPDGTHIAFSSDRDGDFEIYSVIVNGEELVQLTDDPADDRNPAWSPDGALIAFSSERISGDDFTIEEGDKDIYLMSADGSNIVHLTDTLGEEIAPVWAPDGTQLAYDARYYSEPVEGVTVGYDIWLTVPDDPFALPIPITNDPADELVTSWSSDGSWVVFSSNQNGDYEIYLLDLQQGTVRQVTDEPGDDQMADWKP